MTKNITLSQDEFNRFAILAHDAAFDDFYTFQILIETAVANDLEFDCNYDTMSEWIEEKRKAY